MSDAGAATRWNPSCGVSAEADGSLRWRVWAPKSDRAELILDPYGAPRRIAMEAEDGGFFVHHSAWLPSGTQYLFALSGGDAFPDPCSLWQPEGVHRASAVFHLGEYAWHDDAWAGVNMGEMALYELHVGTFTPEGTFAAIIPRLAQLRELGVTAIELMPVGEFPGGRNWGYDLAYAYAAHHAYGGPQGLQRLVDAAHQAGLAVVLDVVYNHLGPEGNYVGQYGPYYTSRYCTPWGSAINFDGPASDPVRQFVIDNALLWVRAFHIDGLRLDATHEIYDHGPWHILAEVQEAVQREAARAGRRITVVAENDRNDPRLVHDLRRGGFGLDGAWSDDFHHAVHALLTGEESVYYYGFGTAQQVAKAFRDVYVFDGQYSPFRKRRHGWTVGDLDRRKFVVCVQNHDQVGNRPAGDRLARTLPREALRLMAGLLLISPYVPLMFMGEEYGEQNPFPFFCSFEDQALVEAVRKGRAEEFGGGPGIPDPQSEETFRNAVLSWSWPAGTWHAGLRRLYRDLLHARRQRPALADRGPARAEAHDGYLRIERGNARRIVAFANYTSARRPLPEIDRLRTASEAASQRGPRWRLWLTTEDACYGGGRDARTPAGEWLPYEMMIFGEGDG